MGICINGIKVAGKGGATVNSPFELAKNGGYTGTEAEFLDQLTTFKIWSYGSTPPSNTNLLWIDSNSGLKRYDTTTSTWVAIPIAGT